MAQMIPGRLLQKPESSAEELLYKEFQRQLPNDFVVFYNRWWQVRDLRKGVQDGEVDFIIAHPKLGIILMEVKGGRIRYDVDSSLWYQNDRPMGKDPIAQVRRSKGNLLALLNEQANFKALKWSDIGHALAFPNVDINSNRLGLDIPREIVLDRRQANNLLSWVIDIYQYHNRPGKFNFSFEDIEQLKKILETPIDLKPLLKYDIEQETQTIIKLTQQQYKLLDFLGQHRRVEIRGCAGSGKTLLAAEKAKRLCAQGFRVLLTCYNKKLAKFLRESLPQKGIIITHFHGLHWKVASSGQEFRYGTGNPNDVYYGKTYPELLIEDAKNNSWEVDAVIVDEGQDFSDNHINALQSLLSDPDHGIFYIFLDENQKLYKNTSISSFDAEPYYLNDNCRNTKQIGDFAKMFLPSSNSIVCSGPEGREVELHQYSTNEELIKKLEIELEYLIDQQRINTQEIVILTLQSIKSSTLSSTSSIGRFRLFEYHSKLPNAIYWTSIRQFKGLEKPVVLLVEAVHEQDKGELITDEVSLYIGVSRARNYLSIYSRIMDDEF